MTKEEYVAKIIFLHSKLCKKPDDYTKEKAKTHNKAVRKLIPLEKELGKDIELAGEVYAELLENEDTYNRQCAATACLYLNIHIKKSVKILEHIVRAGDTMSSSGAERQLKIWRGEIGPNDPG